MKKSLSKLISLALALTVTTLSVIPVSADNPTWSNFFNEDGELAEGVVDAGEIEVEADWMSEIRPDGTSTFNPTFHQYIAPNGDTILAPSATTYIAMIANPTESGIMNVYDTFENGIGMSIASYAMAYSDYTPGSPEYQALHDLLFASQSGITADFDPDSDAYTFLASNAMRMITRLIADGWGDNMLATTYLYYTAESCANSPVGCQAICSTHPTMCNADGTALLDPEELDDIVPDVPSCPASTIVPGAPTLSIAKTAPNNPLVVGQDPDKRGADVLYSAIIPPTVYTYYIPVPVYEDVEICVTPDAGGSAPANAANCKSSPSRTTNDGIRSTVRQLVRVDCEQHILVYSEPVVAVNAKAQLTRESINWIKNDLSGYYYGATTQMESISLVPGMALANAYCDGSKTCYATGTVEKIPFQDPGTFDLNLNVQTGGTPVTTGRTLNTTGSLQVSFISVRLIENGSN